MSVQEDMRRLEELAVSRLLDPLSTDEAGEYAELKARLRPFDDGAIENVVALAHLAVLPEAEPAPRNLRAAVEKDADEFFGNQRMQSAGVAGASPLRTRAFRMSSAGWWVGLAASIVAVLVLVRRAPEVHGPVAANDAPMPVPVPVVPAPPLPPSASPPGAAQQPSSPDRTAAGIESEWRAFLASHPHAIQRAWRSGGDPSGEEVVGDVVWDAASQTGYMRFVGLRRNEPNAEQYQLWIFDAERDQRYPVDGGVFDVTASGGEQIIRIQSKLAVRVPLVFAVTVERPGGVVVSDRSRIAAIADVT